jgi:pyridoxamine 5'-phosphate oxidase family protein
MSIFTEDEIKFLQEETRQKLARIATIGPTGSPHVAPVGFAYNPATDVLEIGGAGLTQTKKWKDLARDPRVAIVIDDVLPPWHPRGGHLQGPRRGMPPALALLPALAT